MVRAAAIQSPKAVVWSVQKDVTEFVGKNRYPLLIVHPETNLNSTSIKVGVAACVSVLESRHLNPEAVFLRNLP
jgi:hypothetical protein